MGREVIYLSFLGNQNKIQETLNTDYKQALHVRREVQTKTTTTTTTTTTAAAAAATATTTKNEGSFSVRGRRLMQTQPKTAQNVEKSWS